jgi:hypothetical protein
MPPIYEVEIFFCQISFAKKNSLVEIMRKTKSIFLMLICLVSFLFVVNWLAPKPQNSFNPEQCTRYCHNLGCKHSQSDEGNQFAKSARKLYFDNIRLLKNNGLGLTYKEMNLLVYVISYPILVLLLFWNVLPKNKT